jgi:hypothetical protein
MVMVTMASQSVVPVLLVVGTVSLDCLILLSAMEFLWMDLPSAALWDLGDPVLLVLVAILLYCSIL